MAHTIAEIAAALGAEAVGDLSLRVGRAAEPAMAGAGDLALAMDPRYADGISKGRALAAIVWPGADWQAMGLKAAIFAPRGRLAMAGRSVAVLEARHVGFGASGRNGGHLNNGLAHSYLAARAAFGPERAQAMYRAFDEGIDTIRAIIAEVEGAIVGSGAQVLGPIAAELSYGEGLQAHAQAAEFRLLPK